MPQDSPRELPTDDERLAAAYAALRALDKLPPSADALATLAGVDVARASEWLAEQARGILSDIC